MAALYLIKDLKSTAPGLNIIARELALELGDASYRPDVLSHTPGLANGVPDHLSRLSLPEYAARAWPPALQGARQVHPAPRTPSWYLASSV